MCKLKNRIFFFFPEMFPLSDLPQDLRENLPSALWWESALRGVNEQDTFPGAVAPAALPTPLESDPQVRNTGNISAEDTFLAMY